MLAIQPSAVDAAQPLSPVAAAAAGVIQQHDGDASRLQFPIPAAATDVIQQHDGGAPKLQFPFTLLVALVAIVIQPSEPHVLSPSALVMLPNEPSVPSLSVLHAAVPILPDVQHVGTLHLHIFPGIS